MARQSRATRSRMPLRAHLSELRHRLVLASLGIMVGAVVGWVLYQPLLRVLQAPLQAASAEQGKTIALNFTGLASAFDMQIKASLFLAVLVSCPWWLYQLWAFITPGLTRREARYSVGFVLAAVPLFLGGAYVAWWVLPHAVAMLADFVPQGATNYTDAQSYLTFVMRFVLAFGLSFVLPVVLVALNFAGILSAGTLRRGWRWAVLLGFVFAAVITPTPDALTMLLVALPVCSLYFAAMGIAIWRDRRRASQVA